MVGIIALVIFMALILFVLAAIFGFVLTVTAVINYIVTNPVLCAIAIAFIVRHLMKIFKARREAKRINGLNEIKIIKMR